MKHGHRITAEDWLNKKWRPLMAFMYMVTCIFDFIIFPAGWSIIQSVHEQLVTQWVPITLQGGGLFHVAMGAVIGVAAWSRGQEKLSGVANSTGAAVA